MRRSLMCFPKSLPARPCTHKRPLHVRFQPCPAERRFCSNPTASADVVDHHSIRPLVLLFIEFRSVYGEVVLGTRLLQPTTRLVNGGSLAACCARAASGHAAAAAPSNVMNARRLIRSPRRRWRAALAEWSGGAFLRSRR